MMNVKFSFKRDPMHYDMNYALKILKNHIFGQKIHVINSVSKILWHFQMVSKLISILRRFGLVKSSRTF